MTIMFHDEEEALESPRKRSRSPKNRDRSANKNNDPPSSAGPA
eukprot:CAMPEP_0113420862 /NCGR_PEP_ID=MMETSP0013_2-20120614/27568_1 /TAXON_ID=2843 ORGANISM="Skeletonema costatum, Strain 1716" /NCGR_SAMPLE_ID=MMETSP0013_2 /ASSEMBLY_ACC=CAM_ASM_000158 /LENGTH=42 /DNA_ID=CAMNT_0000308397 /DNA_START=135 /DNA_END=259 /DNA_ORIENTATION=- /assembly_acc=CAM_ASM_000158